MSMCTSTPTKHLPTYVLSSRRDLNVALPPHAQHVTRPFPLRLVQHRQPHRATYCVCRRGCSYSSRTNKHADVHADYGAPVTRSNAFHLLQTTPTPKNSYRTTTRCIHPHQTDQIMQPASSANRRLGKHTPLTTRHLHTLHTSALGALRRGKKRNQKTG